MLRIRRLLFPTDLSSGANLAYAHAVRLAVALDAELHVLHVRLPYYEDDGSEQGLLPRVSGVGARRLRPSSVEEEHLVPQAPPGELTVRRVIRDGESARESILDYIEQEEIGLVVMGTQGRTGFDHFMMGSIAERVVREASCPVVTVPARASAETVDRVLAPVDFSDFSRQGLTLAKEWAALHEASLDVLHVVQQAVVPTVYAPELGALAMPELVERSTAGLEEFVASAPGPEVPVKTHALPGYAASTILDFAREQRSSFIVMGTHGLTGLKRFLIGSVAERVVREAPCPVLTARSFGESIPKA